MLSKLSFFVGCSLIAYVFFRVVPEIRAHRSARKVQPDHDGNYDLDGVSYDPGTRAVVISGDGRAPDPTAEFVAVEKVVEVLAPEEEKERSIGA